MSTSFQPHLLWPGLWVSKWVHVRDVQSIETGWFNKMVIHTTLIHSYSNAQVEETSEGLIKLARLTSFHSRRPLICSKWHNHFASYLLFSCISMYSIRQLRVFPGFVLFSLWCLKILMQGIISAFVVICKIGFKPVESNSFLPFILSRGLASWYLSDKKSASKPVSRVYLYLFFLFSDERKMI